MPLTKFKLINTEGLTGLFYKGRTVPFEKLDDAMAEQLIGKTHVLERLPEGVQPASSEAVEPAGKSKGK